MHTKYANVDLLQRNGEVVDQRAAIVRSWSVGRRRRLFAVQRCLLAVAVAFLVNVNGQTASWAQGTDIASRAKKLSDEGVDAMLNDNVKDCLSKLEQSYLLSALPKTLFRLGMCEAMAEKNARAWVHLNEYLMHFYTMNAEDQKKHRIPKESAVKELKELGTHVPTLTIQLPSDAPAGVEVRLDGRLLDPLELEVPLRVEPGKHTILQRGPEQREIESSITLESDDKKKWPQDFDPSGRLPAQASDRAPATTASRSSVQSGRSVLPIVVGAAAGVSAISLGFGLMYTGFKRYEEGDRIAASIRSSGGYCAAGAAGGYARQCGTLLGTTKEGDDLNTWGIVAFSVGGIAAASTVTYILLTSPASPVREGIRVWPSVAANKAGIQLSGSF